MFAQSHHEPVAAVRRSPSTSRARAALIAARSASLFVALGVAAASVLVGSHVVFGREPIGGTSGLFALYAATAVIGIGLALFHQLRSLSRRIADSLTPPPAKILKLPASSPAARDAQWKSRPTNAA
jgi:hypothetical protein